MRTGPPMVAVEVFVRDLPSAVHTAPASPQPRPPASVTVTSRHDFGAMRTRHRPTSSCRTRFTLPPFTANEAFAFSAASRPPLGRGPGPGPAVDADQGMSRNSTARVRKRTPGFGMILTARTAGARKSEEKTNVARRSPLRPQSRSRPGSHDMPSFRQKRRPDAVRDAQPGGIPRFLALSAETKATPVFVPKTDAINLPTTGGLPTWTDTWLHDLRHRFHSLRLQIYSLPVSGSG